MALKETKTRLMSLLEKKQKDMTISLGHKHSVFITPCYVLQILQNK